MRIAWAVFVSEAMKLRRTAAWWVAVLTPVVMVFLGLLNLLSRRGFYMVGGPAALAHDLLLGEWQVWAVLAPVLISFETAALINLETGGQHWKQLFAFPAPRWNYFAAKMLLCGCVIAVSFAIFAVGSVGDLLIVSAGRGLDLAGSMPWVLMVTMGMKAYAACWLIIVIQIWISGRISGYAFPIGIGLFALVFGGMLVGMNRDAFSWWYPWTLPVSTLPAGSRDPAVRDTLTPALFGAGAGVVASVFACWDLGRRSKVPATLAARARGVRQ